MRHLIIVMLAAGMLVAMGCREEGAGEKLGRTFDETVDKLKGEKGAFESAGRRVDEARPAEGRCKPARTVRSGVPLPALVRELRAAREGRLRRRTVASARHRPFPRNAHRTPYPLCTWACSETRLPAVTERKCQAFRDKFVLSIYVVDRYV